MLTAAIQYTVYLLYFYIKSFEFKLKTIQCFDRAGWGQGGNPTCKKPDYNYAQKFSFERVIATG